MADQVQKLHLQQSNLEKNLETTTTALRGKDLGFAELLDRVHQFERQLIYEYFVVIPFVDVRIQLTAVGAKIKECDGALGQM